MVSDRRDAFKLKRVVFGSLSPKPRVRDLIPPQSLYPYDFDLQETAERGQIYDPQRTSIESQILQSLSLCALRSAMSSQRFYATPGSPPRRIVASSRLGFRQGEEAGDMVIEYDLSSANLECHKRSITRIIECLWSSAAEQPRTESQLLFLGGISVERVSIANPDFIVQAAAGPFPVTQVRETQIGEMHGSRLLPIESLAHHGDV